LILRLWHSCALLLLVLLLLLLVLLLLLLSVRCSPGGEQLSVT
jgi:hypothetical protein